MFSIGSPQSRGEQAGFHWCAPLTSSTMIIKTRAYRAPRGGRVPEQVEAVGTVSRVTAPVEHRGGT
jgi:hypothetical protein